MNNRDCKKIMKKWMIKYWGKKCPSFEPSCPLCQAWYCFDWLFDPDKYDAPFIKMTIGKIGNKKSD